MRTPVIVTLCAAALVAGAVLLRDREPSARADAPADPARAAARPPATDDEEDLALARALERALEAEPEVPLPLTSKSRQEAEASFELVMEKLEAFADKGDPLSKRRRRRLYRAANDSFSALSAHLDPHSAQDMQTLEDAHARLKQMLREVEAGPP